MKWIDKFSGPYAITMPKIRAKSGLARELAKKAPTYVHTVNSVREMHEYKKNYGITEIYTDFLHPNSSAESK